MAGTIDDELTNIDWAQYVRDLAKGGIRLNMKQIADEIGIKQLIEEVGLKQVIAEAGATPDQLLDALSLEQIEELKRRLQ